MCGSKEAEVEPCPVITVPENPPLPNGGAWGWDGWNTRDMYSAHKSHMHGAVGLTHSKAQQKLLRGSTRTPLGLLV